MRRTREWGGPTIHAGGRLGAQGAHHPLIFPTRSGGPRCRRFPLVGALEYIPRVSAIVAQGLRKVYPLSAPKRRGPTSSTLAFGLLVITVLFRTMGLRSFRKRAIG
jgi:hypothetical protein